MQPISMLRGRRGFEAGVSCLDDWRMASILEKGPQRIGAENSARDELVDAAVRELVDALVAGVAGVSLHRDIPNRSPSQCVKRLPQI